MRQLTNLHKITILCLCILALVSVSIGQTTARTLNDLWSYCPSEDTWTKLPDAAGAPSARRNHGATYDPIRDRLIVFPGVSGVTGTFQSDVKAYSIASGTWATLTARAILGDGTSTTASWPSPGECRDAFYDPTTDQVVLPYTGAGQAGRIKLVSLADDNILTTPLAGQSAWPYQPTREFAAVAYDITSRTIYMFGGSSSSNGGTLTSETLKCDLNANTGWTSLTVTGNVPPPLWLTRAVVDETRKRLIIFGGNRSSLISGQNDYIDDTYELDLETYVWSKITGTRKPLRIGQMGACFDPIHNQPILFGGLTRITNISNDLSCYNNTWTLDTTSSKNWTVGIPPGERPTLRRMPSFTWNTSSSKVLAFGGEEIVTNAKARSELTFPRAGTRVSGNAVHVEAILTYGATQITSQVLFQYRYPSITGAWQDILTSTGAVSNPSPSNPYFVEWDTTVLSGTMDLRAVAADTTGSQDFLAPFTTVIVDHDNPEVIGQSGGPGGIPHNNLAKSFVRSLNPSVLQSWPKNQVNEVIVGDLNKRITTLLRLPSDSLNEDKTINTATETNMLPGQLSNVVKLTVTGTIPQTNSLQPMTIVFSYPDKDGNGIVDNTAYQASSLKIQKVDQFGQSFPGSVVSSVDTVTKTVRAQVTTLNDGSGSTRFALFAVANASVSDWMSY